MTKNEALKLALDALEAWETGCGTTEYLALVEKAVTAIKEALAQPEQEPVQCWKCGDMDAEFQAKCDVPACGMKETKQKPVANYCKECLTYNGHQEGCSHYTTSPQRKPLTDEDLDKLADLHRQEYGQLCDAEDLRMFARSAIEAAHDIKGEA